MSLKTLMTQHRQEEMKAVMRFIATCNIEELAKIIEEIRCYHDCLLSWDVDSKQLKAIESVSINGDAIQLNCIKWEKELINEK